MLNTVLKAGDSTERCGLILNDGTVVDITNRAIDPVNSFEMDPEEVLPYLTSGDVAGTWHTHPTHAAVLSGDDYEAFLDWPDLKHHIVGIADGKVSVKSYEIKNGAVVECD